jgi:hypothetical protein
MLGASPASGDGNALETVGTGEGDDLGEAAVGLDAETVDAPGGADYDVEEIPVLGCLPNRSDHSWSRPE